MALEVYLDGHVRKITGEVQDSNTSDVVTALVNASNKTGRFSLVLVNKTNSVEYYLRTSDCPYQILQSLKERGIDACLEIRPVDLFDSNQNIYAQQSSEFEQMLNAMSDAELEELIQEQDKTLWQHQIKIVGLESAMIEESDREYLQLLKQRHNLRQTLNELNAVDWQSQKAYEINQLNSLQSSVERLRQELNNKQLQLERILNELDRFN